MSKLGLLSSLAAMMTNKTPNDRPSWSLITLHKAGSTYVAEMVRRIFVANGYETLDPCGDAFRAGIKEPDYVASHLAEFDGPNRVVGPFRADTAALVGGLKGLRPIIHVRDVRDCIVSNFFSIAFSHSVPREAETRERFLAVRQKIQEGSIDQYVEQIMWSRSAFARIDILREICEKRPDAVLSRYEDMVTDFPKWLDGLLDAIGLTIPAKLRKELTRGAAFDVDEDKNRHKRQVIPGDFRRKLLPETQAKLTEKFRTDLAYFGYAE
jgi:hypothetical protein